MAAGTAIGKIGKIDFFACLPSGAYAFLCLYLAYSIVIGLEEGTSKEILACKFQVLSINDEDNSSPEFSEDKCNAFISETNKKWTISVFDKDAVFIKELIINPSTDQSNIPQNKLIKEVKSELYYASNKNHEIWGAINQLIKKTSSEPTSLLLIIFSAFLLGSVFRALPVEAAEHFWEYIHKMFKPESKFKQKFPYPEEINVQTDIIKKYLYYEKKFSLFSPLIHPVNIKVFNYWKEVLCIHSPEGFEYYQEYEIRTRFFSSIIFSAFAGVIISVVIAPIVIYWKNLDWEIFIPLLYIFTLSIFILIFFGMNMRRVRILEQQTLTGLYVAYIQSVKSEE